MRKRRNEGSGVQTKFQDLPSALVLELRQKSHPVPASKSCSHLIILQTLEAGTGDGLGKDQASRRTLGHVLAETHNHFPSSGLTKCKQDTLVNPDCLHKNYLNFP